MVFEEKETVDFSTANVSFEENPPKKNKNAIAIIHDLCELFPEGLNEIELNRRSTLIWANILKLIQDEAYIKNDSLNLTNVNYNDVIAAAILSLGNLLSKNQFIVKLSGGQVLNVSNVMKKYGGITSFEHVTETYKLFYSIGQKRKVKKASFLELSLAVLMFPLIHFLNVINAKRFQQVLTGYSSDKITILGASYKYSFLYDLVLYLVIIDVFLIVLVLINEKINKIKISAQNNERKKSTIYQRLFTFELLTIISVVLLALTSHLISSVIIQGDLKALLFYIKIELMPLYSMLFALIFILLILEIFMFLYEIVRKI